MATISLYPKSVIFRVEEAVQVDHKIAHMCIVDCGLCLGFPRCAGGSKVRINANNVEFVQITERDAIEFGQLAAKYQVQKLFFIRCFRQEFCSIYVEIRGAARGALVLACLIHCLAGEIKQFLVGRRSTGQ